MEEANKLIALGKKHLQEEEEVMKAVDVLQEASGMLAKQFGEKADECGQAYYWYAVALLEQERMENRVLGNALAGICVEVEEEKSEDSIVEGTEKLDEKTMDELRVQVYDAMAEREGETKAQKKDDAPADKEKDDNAAEKRDEDSTAEKKELDKALAEKKDQEKAEGNQSNPAEKDEQKTVKEEDKDKVSDGKEPNSGEKEETEAEVPEDESKEAEDGEEEEMEVEGGEGAEGQDGEDIAGKDSDDEVENLQLAWEMLELAKIIYKRKDTKEDQLMLSQIHLKLGEVSAESGNCKDAKEDFNECLNLQLKYLEPDSRVLAETYYNLGLLYTNISQHDDAAESLSRAVTIINARLENLQKLIDNAAGPEDLPDERQEMTNLQSLLPDMKTKEAEAIQNAKMAKVAPELQVNGSSADENSSETQATDISHLVRKKRKPESPKECVGKKVKQDEANDDEEPHTSGTQGQSSGTQGQSSEAQSSGTQSNGTQGQSSETQSGGAQGQGSGTQGQSSGAHSSRTQGQSRGAHSSGTEEQDDGTCNETQGEGSGTSHGQSNGPHNGPVGLSNGHPGPSIGPHPQSNGHPGPSIGPHPQSNGPPNGTPDQSNGTHGQSSGAEGEGN